MVFVNVPLWSISSYRLSKLAGGMRRPQHFVRYFYHIDATDV